MTPYIQEKVAELRILLDDARTGLRDSSNTNKNRSSILAIFVEVADEAYEKGKNDGLDELAQRVEGKMQKKPSTECVNAEMAMFGRCFDCMKACGHNTALDTILSEIAEMKKTVV